LLKIEGGPSKQKLFFNLKITAFFLLFNNIEPAAYFILLVNTIYFIYIIFDGG